MATEQHGLRVGRARTIEFAQQRDSWGRPLDDEAALRVTIGLLRALPVPWEPPMPDFIPGRVDPKLVAEAAARRIRSLVPALERVEMGGMARELERLVRVLDAFSRVSNVVDGVDWSHPQWAILDEAAAR
jgi:hypothetical protein